MVKSYKGLRYLKLNNNHSDVGITNHCEDSAVKANFLRKEQLVLAINTKEFERVR